MVPTFSWWGRCAGLFVGGVRVVEKSRGRVLGRSRRANVPSHDGVDGRRRKRYEVSVNPAEDAALRARAVVAGVTVPRLLVESAMDANVETATLRKQAIAALFDVKNQIGMIGSNMNQLAKFANTEGVFPAEAERLQAEFAALFPVLHELTEALTRR